MTPNNKFRYTVTNANGNTLVSPFGEADFKKEWGLESDGPFDYSTTFPNKIIFRDTIYQSLLAIENSGNRCAEMFITIDRNCGGTWTPWFTGVFNLNGATWDLYRCEVEIKIEKRDDEDCLQDNKSVEVNLFEEIGTERATVRPYAQAITIEKLTYKYGPLPNTGFFTTDYWPVAGTPAAAGWVSFYNYSAIIHDVFFKDVRETRYARQVLNVPVGQPAPGAEWIYISTTAGVNKWAKPAALYECTEENIPQSGQIYQAYKKECKILGEGGGISQIDNGFTLREVLEVFPRKFCPYLIIKSEFFQINPDTVTSTNYVTGQPSKVSNILVFQKSDVKRPAVSGNATKAPATWEKITETLRSMFNVRWRISGNVLRIEHISYFTKTAGFNLTLPKYAAYNTGLKKYSYKTEQIPQREEFKFMEASPGDFAGIPIEYFGGCVSKEGKQNVKTHSAGEVSTDVELILNNPDANSNVVANTGLVFIAANAAGVILAEPPILQTGTRLNNSLAWAQLQRDYHRHYRPLRVGILNGVPMQFFSVEPTKKGVTLSIPLCCGDVFNPDNLVTTELGEGAVESARYSFRDDMLEIDLVYPSNLSFTIPARAISDLYTVPANTASPLDILANDIPGSSGAITQIDITTPPSHGGVTVDSSLNVVYTPLPGYFGQDYINYRVNDLGGNPSNVALIAIDVISNVYVRLTKENETQQYLTIPCPQLSAGGESKVATFRLSYFSDPAGTIPLDTTGMGLEIVVKSITVYMDPNNPPVDYFNAYPATGTTQLILTDFEFYRLEYTCAMEIGYFKSELMQIAPGPYNIL